MSNKLFNHSKKLLIVSVGINLTLGIVLARYAGEEKALLELNALYLSSACSDTAQFRVKLEAYDLSHLPVEISETERQKWINKQLSNCGKAQSLWR